MGRLIAALFCVLTSGASASDWTYGSFDNGSWFEAHVVHESHDVALHCGGQSPGGSLPQTDEPMITQPYVVDLTLAQSALGQPDGFTVLPPRGDIVVATDTAAYQLPGASYDELNQSGYIQSLSMGDALIESLIKAKAMAVDAGGARLGTYPAGSLGDALTRLIAFCDARWAAAGRAVPAAALPIINDVRSRGLDVAPFAAGQPEQSSATLQPAAPQAQRRDAGLWASVLTYLNRSCEGSVAAFDEGFARAANLDGDGVEDYIVAWDAITCAGALARPFCGASQCAVDIFASSVYTPGSRPETVYAQAVDVVPGADGRDLVQIAGRLATCQTPGAPPDCLFLWAWTNGTLQRAN